MNTYGGRIISTENPEIHQLTGLHSKYMYILCFWNSFFSCSNCTQKHDRTTVHIVGPFLMNERLQTCSDQISTERSNKGHLSSCSWSPAGGVFRCFPSFIYELRWGFVLHKVRILNFMNSQNSYFSTTRMSVQHLLTRSTLCSLQIIFVCLFPNFRYFVRRQQPESLLDTSFGPTDPGIKKRWGIKRRSAESHHSVDMCANTEYHDDPPCQEEEEEVIKLQTFPIAVPKTPITSDQSICKSCNVWL